MELVRTVVLPAQKETPDLRNGSLFFVGTATVILRYAGFSILTDPNFLHLGEHVHLGYGLKAKRLTNPAIGFGALPTIDMVLLSHLHEDHFDRLVAKKLSKTVPIVTTSKAAKTLRNKMGFRVVHGLQTWQSLTFVKGSSQLKITSTPGKHGPGPLNAALPQVMGSLLEFQNDSGKTAFRMYISGDTLIHRQLREIPKRFPDIDLALLHLGGTRLFGVLLTMDAKQGVEAIKIINPREAIPIHYNDYDVFKSPLEDFRKAVEEAKLQKIVRYLGRGDTYNIQIPDNRL